jgi:putative hydrolase of the HAD superfamily
MQRWAQCPHTQAFEARKLSASDWSSRFVRDWGLSLTPEQFLAEFEGWSRGFFPGAVELLSALRPRYRLAALSNSNPLHWARNARLGIPGHFEFVMSSHEVGCCKPERAIFEAALQRAGLPAEDVVFFDDLQKNVDGAKAVGIRAWQVQGVEGVMQCLRAQRLLEQSWTIKAST